MKSITFPILHYKTFLSYAFTLYIMYIKTIEGSRDVLDYYVILYRLLENREKKLIKKF